MHFSHSVKLWEDFPQLVPGLIVVEGIHPEVSVEGVLQTWFKQAEQNLNQQTESEIPAVAAWRRAYSQMGLKPTKYRSASEALLRRFRRERDLPRIHPLIDMCNALSLAFALPVAVFDLAGVDSYMEVRYANGDEQYLAFNGDIETPAEGEVIFADADKHAHARRWTFRQSRRSTINPDTEKALIITEGLHETAAQDIQTLLGILIKNIREIWSVSGDPVILTSEHRLLEF